MLNVISLIYYDCVFVVCNGGGWVGGCMHENRVCVCGSIGRILLNNGLYHSLSINALRAL